VGDGGFNEGEYDIEVVNHQVEDDADVRAAGRIGREPVRFDKARFTSHGFEVFEDRVESLDMTNLQNTIFLARKQDEFGGLGGIVGHGFFDKHMLAQSQDDFGEVKMSGGGCDQTKGVAGGGGFSNGTEDVDAVFRCDLRGGIGPGVVDAGKFHMPGAGEVGINAYVFLAVETGSDDGDFEGR